MIFFCTKIHSPFYEDKVQRYPCQAALVFAPQNPHQPDAVDSSSASVERLFSAKIV